MIEQARIEAVGEMLGDARKRVSMDKGLGFGYLKECGERILWLAACNFL